MRRTFSAPAFSHFHDQWHLSSGVDTGEYVFFSGATGCRPDGTVATDPEEQFRDAFKFLADTLAAGDLSWGSVVEMTTYHVDLRKHLDDFITVKDEFIAAPYPALSSIGTAELITEGTLLEIRVICHRPPKGKSKQLSLQVIEVPYRNGGPSAKKTLKLGLHCSDPPLTHTSPPPIRPLSGVPLPIGHDSFWPYRWPSSTSVASGADIKAGPTSGGRTCGPG